MYTVQVHPLTQVADLLNDTKHPLLLTQVADLLNDTKSLEMVEQNIYRMKREKELVETRLKEAVEAQLRGVRYILGLDYILSRLSNR